MLSEVSIEFNKSPTMHTILQGKTGLNLAIQNVILQLPAISSRAYQKETVHK